MEQVDRKKLYKLTHALERANIMPAGAPALGEELLDALKPLLHRARLDDILRADRALAAVREQISIRSRVMTDKATVRAMWQAFESGLKGKPLPEDRARKRGRTRR